MTFEQFQSCYIQRSQSFLDDYLSLHADEPSDLLEAMRYSLLNGGKRLRALLVYATGISFNTPLKELDIAAAAVEMIHTFSLIHDDLPAMDDDDIRRGQPTCHKAFDEATAILAGDALHTEAFDLLSSYMSDFCTPISRLKMVQCLANAIGRQGMVQGQTIDVSSQGKALSLDSLKHMHHLKTGRLIQASVELGELASLQTNPKAHSALTNYSKSIGLAFQIKDDILDATTHTDVLGKTAGKDADNNKPTFVSLMGIEAAESTLLELHQQAISALQQHPQLQDSFLIDIANFITDRAF